MPWPRSEFSKEKLAKNGNAIAPVQRDSTDVEDTGNCSIRAKTDQIDSDAEEDGDPDCIQWRSGHWVNFRPDRREGYKSVTGEGKDCSAKRLHGCEAHEFDDDQTSDGEEDAACLAEAVVEDLSDGLVDWAGENRRRVAHAEAKDDIEEETSEIREEHGH